MLRSSLAVLAALALVSLPSLAPARAQPTADAVGRGYGVWRNPKDSVHVEIRNCGANACGYVVWASARAQADARKGSAENLIGLKVLRDFVPEKTNLWRGKVYAPDLNMTFSGTAEFIDASTMRAKGCLIGGLLCKAQIWKRVDGAAS